MQGAAHRLPENSPSIDKHSKRTFDVDAELAEVKVKCVFVQGELFARERREYGLRATIRCISCNPKVPWKFAAFNLTRQLRVSPGNRIVDAARTIDEASCEFALAITDSLEV